MAGAQRPGPVGTDNNSPTIDAGTAARIASPLPGSFCVATKPAAAEPRWGLFDTVRWKALPSWLGGDRQLLKNFKDSWLRRQRGQVKRLAAAQDLSPLLLAGVAWIEVGGDPHWIDSVAYPVRAFDHAADPFLEALTITARPELTSFGSVSIQLRRAAESLGLNYATMSSEQRGALIDCLGADETNLNVVAEHLRQLRQIDFRAGLPWSDDQLRVVGTRYNRGPELSLAAIRKNTSYGDFILRHRTHILGLLEPP